MILPLIETAIRASPQIGIAVVVSLRKRFGRGSSGFDEEGTMLLLAGSGECGLAPAPA
jgi:hypothetical protein